MEPKVSIGWLFKHGWKPSYPNYNKRMNCPRCGTKIWDCQLKPHMRTERCMNTGIPKEERPPMFKIPKAHMMKHEPCRKCGRPFQTGHLKRHLSTCQGLAPKRDKYLDLLLELEKRVGLNKD